MVRSRATKQKCHARGRAWFIPGHRVRGKCSAVHKRRAVATVAYRRAPRRRRGLRHR